MGRSEELDDETTDDQEETSGNQESTESDDLFEDMEIPQGLEDVRKNMQRDYTRKTQAIADERKQMEIEVERLRQKAEMYDKLAQDPDDAIEILSRMSGKSSKSHAVTQDEDDDDFSDYGDNAESMKRLVKSITNRVTKSITREMSPLLQSSQEGAFAREMQNLSTWVKSQRETTGLNMPDPETLETTIRDRMNRKGDTAIEAYKASMNLAKLPTRKPVEDKKKKVGTFQPGGTNKGSPKKLGLTPDDAIARRRDGKRGGYSLEELSAMYDNKEI